jgi:type VI secretion system protein VasJ
MTMSHIIGSSFDSAIAPFGGDAPYGVNAQYGERYEAIQREIQKLTAASSKETSVDWPVVRNLSLELLSQESKDLSVACYLTVALFMTHGYGGARDGLEIVRTLVGEHWSGMYPPVQRVVRRANDLRWLEERLALLIEAREITPTDAEHIEPMVDHANEIAALAREHLKEKAPGFGELVGALSARARDAKTMAPAEESAGGPIPEESRGPAGASSLQDTAPRSVPAAAQSVSREAAAAIGEGASAQQVRSHLESFVKMLRDADPLSPASYRILRILKWEGAAGPPMAGDTRIPGPRPNELTPLATMFQASNWPGLLDRSENMFKAGHIWLLDLQRYSSISLERIDPKGQQSQAAAAIKDATREILDRIPFLIDCTYAGGLPFASDETREWLGELAATDTARVLIPRPTGDVTDEAAFEPGDLDQAIELLRAKQLTQGMEILQRGIKRAADRRSQFRARLDAARTCLDANQATWARPMLEALKREAESLTFEVWEPAWAIELHQLLAICYGRLAKAAKAEEQQNFITMAHAVQDALCRLDVQAAAAIEDELS